MLRIATASLRTGFAMTCISLQLRVLSWGDAVFLFKRPIEGGIVRKTHTAAYIFQAHALGDITLGGNQPSLGHAAIKAGTHFLTK